MEPAHREQRRPARPARAPREGDSGAAGRRILRRKPTQPITYNIRIRTISFSGAYAETWTAPIQIEIPLPRESMPKLSLPITSSRLGTVKVEWDGLSDAGIQMPPQFRE